jgi:hypothetical protein
MARRRTGSLEPRKGIWHARLTISNSDGTTSRPWCSLETSDKAVAKRKLARLNKRLQAGESLEAAASEARAIDTVSQYARPTLEKREDSKVSGHDDLQRFEKWIEPWIGPMPLDEARATHITEMLQAAADAGLKRETIKEIRNVALLIFKKAWKAELIQDNPVLRAEMPEMKKETKRQRTILTDNEVTAYLGCGDVSAELRLILFSARAEAACGRTTSTFGTGR